MRIWLRSMYILSITRNLTLFSVVWPSQFLHTSSISQALS